MSNPNHPYRQRVVSPPNSAPYPINEIDYNNNNNNGSNSAVNSNSTLPRHNGSSASLGKGVGSHNGSQVSINKNRSPVAPESGSTLYQTPIGSQQNSPQHQQFNHNILQAPPLNNIAPNGPILKSPTINAINNPPYPYEAQTPPPVFAPTRDSNPHMVTSPQSIPLSATSSVTNLNLSHQGNQSVDQQLHLQHLQQPQQQQPLASASTTTSTQQQQQAIYSKSENNLLTPPSKYIHSRSISSSSSFFYDRNDHASMIDFSQNIIQQHLGSNSTQLLPRIKTIELYRKNAKKSNDPTVLFQYAQYMLQTALLLDSESLNPQATATNANNSSSNASSFNTPTQSIENSPKKNSPFGKDHNGSLLSLPGQHKKSRSANSIDALGNEGNGEKMDDKKLKRSLLKEAVFYLRKLSDKGYVEAQYLLADAYSSGALGRIENREAFVLFQAAAKHSHIESAYRTSYCYEEGLGTGRDARKAVDYLKMAASKNHAAAMYKLGIYSFYGRMGLPHDIATKKLGIKWLERASNVANELTAAAPFELGKIFYNGFQDIVIPDQKYALELYSQAAALGHVEAAAILGQCYEHGEIVNQDNDLSIHYYTQAALGGDPESMLAMCAWYLVGSEPFLPKDDNEAFEWARRAALCNLPKAQFALANFYDKGIGCIKNSQEAQIWYKKAAENGEEKSISRISDKDTANKLQKQILKKKSSGKLFNGSGNNPNHSSSNSKNAAQDKDCVIM